MFAPLVLLLCSGSSKTMALPPILQNVTCIVTLGDSITQMGASPKGYVTVIDETLKKSYPDHPIEVINAGISGQKAPDMLARFQHDVLDRHPQIVTISVGVNDVWHNFRNPEWTARVAEGNSGRGVPIDTYIADVDAMILAAQKVNVLPILVSPTLVYEDLDCAENKRLTEYVHAEKALAAKRHVPFVDLNRPFHEVVSHYQEFAGKRTLLLTVDGVHMNDQGNAMMADLILKAMQVPAPDNLSP